MKRVGLKIQDQLNLVNSYLELTRPVHHLTPANTRVLSYFIDAYLDLKPKVLDEDLIWKLVFTNDVRIKIMKELDISKNSLSNSEKVLKNKGFISNGKVNKSIIPELDNGNLKLYIYLYK